MNIDKKKVQAEEKYSVFCARFTKYMVRYTIHGIGGMLEGISCLVK